jgi:predicted transcriptional regulator
VSEEEMKNNSFIVKNKEIGLKKLLERYFLCPRELANSGEAFEDFELRVLLKLFEASEEEGKPIAEQSIERLAKAVGRTERKVKETIRILEAKKVLSKEAKQRQDGVGVYNEYTLAKFRYWWKKIGRILRESFKREKLEKYKMPNSREDSSESLSPIDPPRV